VFQSLKNFLVSAPKVIENFFRLLRRDFFEKIRFSQRARERQKGIVFFLVPNPLMIEQDRGCFFVRVFKCLTLWQSLTPLQYGGGRVVQARSDFFQRKNRNYRPIFWPNFDGSEEILRKLSTFLQKSRYFLEKWNGFKSLLAGRREIGYFWVIWGGGGVVKGRSDFYPRGQGLPKWHPLWVALLPGLRSLAVFISSHNTCMLL